MKVPSNGSIQPQGACQGFAIIAVLWILGALSALLSIYTVYVVNTAASLSPQETRLRAEAAASAAVELTAYRQLAIEAQNRPTRGQFRFRLDSADVNVLFSSEAARIDLNAAPKPLLSGLFRALGAQLADAESYADSLVKRRTPPANRQDSPNSMPDMNRGDESHGTKFQHVRELSQVRGLPAQLVERALPFVTIYSGRPQINVMDAAPEVIAALPGMTAERLKAVLLQRQIEPLQQQAVLQMLGPSQPYAASEGSRAVRIGIHMAFDNGYQTQSEVVILLFDEGSEPFSILSWSDESPSGTR